MFALFIIKDGLKMFARPVYRCGVARILNFYYIIDNVITLPPPPPHSLFHHLPPE